MKPHEKLPWELIWQHDGHVTDVVVTAMADGEEAIVPEVALGHVEGCDVCSRRLGEAALLSLHIEQRVVALAACQAAQRPRFPWPAVLAALAVAGVGMVPALLEVPEGFASLVQAFVQGLPLTMRSVALMVRTIPDHLQGTLLAMVFGSAVVLALTGFGIARTMTRARSTEGGAV
jgi:hypothetical protein